MVDGKVRLPKLFSDLCHIHAQQTCKQTKTNTFLLEEAWAAAAAGVGVAFAAGD